MGKDVKSAIAASGFGFKKKFGQNFITDEKLLDEIAALSGAGKDDTVVEIGCGAGTLTRAVAKRVKKIISFEVDESLEGVLAKTLDGVDNAEVIFQDFLKVNLKELEEKTGEYFVVANIPYYITSPLIMKFIEESEKCKSLTVMVQEEVAHRLCAAPGTPEYGSITASLALRAEAKIVKAVPRTYFFPRPNVDSAVVNLTIQDGRIAVRSADWYKKTVRAAFTERRKTLANNIMKAFNLSRERAEGILQSCGIDLKARGETLSPEQFALLSDRILSYEIM